MKKLREIEGELYTNKLRHNGTPDGDIYAVWHNGVEKAAIGEEKPKKPEPTDDQIVAAFLKWFNLPKGKE